MKLATEIETETGDRSIHALHTAADKAMCMLEPQTMHDLNHKQSDEIMSKKEDSETCNECHIPSAERGRKKMGGAVVVTDHASRSRALAAACLSRRSSASASCE